MNNVPFLERGVGRISRQRRTRVHNMPTGGGYRCCYRTCQKREARINNKKNDFDYTWYSALPAACVVRVYVSRHMLLYIS